MTPFSSHSGFESTRVRFRLAGLVICVLHCASSSQAQTTDLWANATTSFSTASNWANGAPVDDLTTTIAQFSFGTAVNPVLGTSQSVAGLLFMPGASLYSLSATGGSTLTLGASGIFNLSLGSSETLALNLTLGASQTWSSAGGTLGIGTGNDGTTLALGTNTLTLTGSATAGRIFANITGSGPIIVNTAVGGSWTLDNGVDTTHYTGNVTVNGGTLLLNSATTFSGDMTVNETTAGASAAVQVNANSTIGHLTFGGSGASSTGANTVDIGRDTSLTIAGGTVTYDATNAPKGASLGLPAGGSLVLGSNTTFNVASSAGSSAPELVVNAVVAGSGSLTKTGTGTLQLVTANTYTGGTTVSNGTLFVANGENGSATGTGSVLIQSGARLEGFGTIAGATTIASGALVTPGTFGTTGSLTFVQGLTLGSGSTYDFDLGTASDVIAVNGGTLTGNGGLTLNLNAATGMHAGTYTLFNYAGGEESGFDASDFTIGTTISGYTFSLLDSGSTLELVATVSAVPEPSTYATVMGVCVLGFAGLRRRQSSLAA